VDRVRREAASGVDEDGEEEEEEEGRKA